MNVAAYVHPVAGGVVTALLMYTASLGLRARANPRQAAGLLRRHSRFAPVVYWLVVASFLGGFGSAWFVRPDLQPAASMHMRIGVALVAALSGGYLSARRMDVPVLRAVHPWCGAAAALLGAAQIFFGLQITP